MKQVKTYLECTKSIIEDALRRVKNLDKEHAMLCGYKVSDCPDEFIERELKNTCNGVIPSDDYLAQLYAEIQRRHLLGISIITRKSEFQELFNGDCGLRYGEAEKIKEKKK